MEYQDHVPRLRGGQDPFTRSELCDNRWGHHLTYASNYQRAAEAECIMKAVATGSFVQITNSARL